MSKSNQIQLSDHFTTGRLLKFTASPIIMMIFTSIYTIVDGFFVSNCAGKTAFTALNLHLPLYPDAGLPRLYDRHGRQCAGRHDAGHGR